MSTTAVLAVHGECARADLDKLIGRVQDLLRVGVVDLVLDLSAVTTADTTLLRTVSRIHRAVNRRDGSLALVGVPAPPILPDLDKATLEQAFLIYRSLPHTMVTGGRGGMEPTRRVPQHGQVE